METDALSTPTYWHGWKLAAMQTMNEQIEKMMKHSICDIRILFSVSTHSIFIESIFHIAQCI